MGNKFIVLLILFCLCSSCSTSFDDHGLYHRIQKGENLFWVAKSYGVDLQDLAELNNIEDTEKSLEPGEKLYIPPKRLYRHKKLPFEGKLSEQLREHPKYLGEKRRKKKKSVLGEAKKAHTEHSRFEWPVDGPVISPFGIRHGKRHDGVDIKAVQGTSIKAAEKGQVVFAGTMRGYGNLILVKHDDNFFTAYAHAKVNLVKEKQKVKKGEVIAKVGRTGHATGAHLHFEVREGEKARNPLFFLPVIK